MNHRRRLVFHLLLLLALLAALWALAIAATGGIAIGHGAWRFRARSSRNPFLGAVASIVAALLFLPAGRRRRELANEWIGLVRVIDAWVLAVRRIGPRLAPFIGASLALAVFGLAVARGSFIAGGSDEYAYLSEAELFASGTLRVEQPIMREVTWPDSARALTPPGWTPLGDASIVPITAPGYPIVMAATMLVAGRHSASFILPLLAGLAVWCTYVLGRRLAGGLVGVAAAALLATSPTFLLHSLLPLSDLPGAAWWSLALVLVLYESRGAALAAGIAAGVAILTRPNFVPVAVVPGLYLLWPAVGERSLTGRATQRAVLYAAGAAPFCAAVGVLNAIWYGSPVGNGYRPFDQLYQWANFAPNAMHYATWIAQTQTPVIGIALAAPWLLSERDSSPPPRSVATMCLAFIAGILGCQLLLTPFDNWLYLRYLLPAFPPLCVLTSVSLAALVTRLVPRARTLVLTSAILLLSGRGLWYSDRHLVFNIRNGQEPYQSVGEYVRRRLPERAVVLTMLHSGSVRYYSERLTVRWMFIPETALDRVVDQLRRQGLSPYLVLTSIEVDDFRKRFGRRSRLAALDWPPIARGNFDLPVEIFDLAAPADGPGRAPTITEPIE
jgi:hypothetical protein